MLNFSKAPSITIVIDKSTAFYLPFKNGKWGLLKITQAHYFKPAITLSKLFISLNASMFLKLASLNNFVTLIF